MICGLTWSMIHDEISSHLGVRREYVVDLIKAMQDTGTILTFGNSHGTFSKRGQGSHNYRNSRQKLNKEYTLALTGEVDRLHTLGKTVTNLVMRNYI